MPLFILVDSTTASASELFARHLQLERKAVVIGDHTLGAVTEANYLDEEVGAGMVIAYGINVGTAKIVLPGGEILEKKGITPDVNCVPTEDDLREKRDPCLDLAAKLAQDAIAPKATVAAAPVKE